MGWRFWRREPTEAERSLAALQAQQAAPPPPPVTPPPELAALDRLRARADDHMSEVTQRLEELLAATPVAERGAFMLEVVTVVPGSDGTVEVTGGASTGTVEVGAVVGLLLLPPGAAEAWSPQGLASQQPDDVAAMTAHLETLLGTTAASATVVSWRPEGPALVLTDVDPSVVTVGSMVSR